MDSPMNLPIQYCCSHCFYRFASRLPVYNIQPCDSEFSVCKCVVDKFRGCNMSNDNMKSIFSLMSAMAEVSHGYSRSIVKRNSDIEDLAVQYEHLLSQSEDEEFFFINYENVDENNGDQRLGLKLGRMAHSEETPMGWSRGTQVYYGKDKMPF